MRNSASVADLVGVAQHNLNLAVTPGCSESERSTAPPSPATISGHMFTLPDVCRFTREENIKSHSKVKSSEQRAIRAQILEQYPALEPFIEDVLPKKEPLFVCKWC